MTETQTAVVVEAKPAVEGVVTSITTPAPKRRARVSILMTGLLINAGVLQGRAAGDALHASAL